MGIKKIIIICLIHLLVGAHIAIILAKDNQSPVEGILFFTYVLTGALYWKKIAKQKKKEYAK